MQSAFNYTTVARENRAILNPKRSERYRLSMRLIIEVMDLAGPQSYSPLAIAGLFITRRFRKQESKEKEETCGVAAR
jgi:hypothetical protein